MKVKAIRMGIYGKVRRYEGDIFDIKESEFSKFWMTKDIESKPGKQPKPAKTADKDATVI